MLWTREATVVDSTHAQAVAMAELEEWVFQRQGLTWSGADLLGLPPAAEAAPVADLLLLEQAAVDIDMEHHSKLHHIVPLIVQHCGMHVGSDTDRPYLSFGSTARGTGRTVREADLDSSWEDLVAVRTYCWETLRIVLGQDLADATQETDCLSVR